MPYDPDLHHRHSIRLRGYDYASRGTYFVTLCTLRHRYLFGAVTDGEIHLSPYGRVVEMQWARIPDLDPMVRLDVWQVMPNHSHGLIEITGTALEDPAASSDDGNESPAIRHSPGQPSGPRPRSLSAIVGNLQSVTARRINSMRRTPGAPIWQRGFWDRIVRDEDELQRIRHYIITNAARWDKDVLNPLAKQASPPPSGPL